MSLPTTIIQQIAVFSAHNTATQNQTTICRSKTCHTRWAPWAPYVPISFTGRPLHPVFSMAGVPPFPVIRKKQNRAPSILSNERSCMEPWCLEWWFLRSRLMFLCLIHLSWWSVCANLCPTPGLEAHDEQSAPTPALCPVPPSEYLAKPKSATCRRSVLTSKPFTISRKPWFQALITSDY